MLLNISFSYYLFNLLSTELSYKQITVRGMFCGWESWRPDIDGRAQIQALEILGLTFYNVPICKKKNPYPPQFNHVNLTKYGGGLALRFPTARIQVFILC